MIETQHVAVTAPDGLKIVQIITTVPIQNFDPDTAAANGFKLAEDHWTRKLDNDAIKTELARAGFTDMPWRKVKPDDIPTDRAFRGALVDTGRRIVFDMAKAREIQRDRLRAVRAPLLAALDVEYQRADEGDDAERKAAIVARKRALRDVTKDPAIDKAKTVEELAAVTIGQLD